MHKPRFLVLEFSGAAGTLATIDVDKGFELQEIFSKELELNIPSVPRYSSRDNLAEILSIIEMFAPECAVPLTTPISNLQAMVTGAKEYSNMSEEPSGCMKSNL